jgi:hypothetical protein
LDRFYLFIWLSDEKTVARNSEKMWKKR